MHIPIQPGEPSWSDSESAVLRDFLNSGTGQRLLSRLHWLRPQVNTYVPEERRARQDARTGYEECLEQILLLAASRPLSAADLEAQTLSPAPEPPG